MHIARQHNRLGLRFLLRAEGQRIPLDLLAENMADALQHVVGGGQHRLRGDGCAGNCLDGVAAVRAHALELLRAFSLLPACAEACRLGEIRIADLGAGHLAVHVNAERHRDVAAVALRGRHGAVADGLPVLLRLNKLRYLVALGDIHRAEGIRLHDGLEGGVLRGFLVLLNRSLGDGVRHSQSQCSHQRDNRQNDV